MNRNHLKTVLKINGLSVDSPDDEIRAVLVHARYSETEIDSALVILRESVEMPQARVGGLHSVMYSDKTLRPQEVISLLGVDVDLELPISFRSRHARIETVDGILIIGGAISVAAVGILLFMFFYKVGIFYPEIGSF